MTTREFTHRVLILVAITLVAAIFVLLIVTAADVFLVIFAGVLFAILLRSVADLIDRHTPLSAGWSLALVLVVLALLIGSAAYFLAAEIASQLDQLTQSIAKSWQELRGRLGNEAWGRQLLTMISGTPASGQELLSHASRIFSTTLGAVGNVAVVLFIGITSPPIRSGIAGVFCDCFRATNVREAPNFLTRSALRCAGG